MVGSTSWTVRWRRHDGDADDRSWQAKCIIPGGSISPSNGRRSSGATTLVGVFVTTGVFSRQAQIEIIDDRYPIVLISARRLAEEVRRMAHSTHAGEVEIMLDAVTSGYETAITNRRPEEVLNG